MNNNNNKKKPGIMSSIHMEHGSVMYNIMVQRVRIIIAVYL